MNITNQYYNENAQSFFDTTVNVDVQKLYDRFLPRINHQGKYWMLGVARVEIVKTS